MVLGKIGWLWFVAFLWCILLNVHTSQSTSHLFLLYPILLFFKSFLHNLFFIKMFLLLKHFKQHFLVQITFLEIFNLGKFSYVVNFQTFTDNFLSAYRSSFSIPGLLLSVGRKCNDYIIFFYRFLKYNFKFKLHISTLPNMINHNM